MPVEQDDPEAPAERSFVATAVPNAKQRYSTYAVLLVVSSVYPISQEFSRGFDFMTAYGAIVFPVMLLGLAAMWGVALHRLWTKKVVLCVTADGLTVDQRSDEVYSLRAAELGQWRKTRGRGGNSVGRALYLPSGPHRFVLGAQEYGRASDIPKVGPQVEVPRLDAYTSVSAFDELLALVGSARGE